MTKSVSFAFQKHGFWAPFSQFYQTVEGNDRYKNFDFSFGFSLPVP